MAKCSKIPLKYSSLNEKDTEPCKSRGGHKMKGVEVERFPDSF